MPEMLRIFRSSTELPALKQRANTLASVCSVPPEPPLEAADVARDRPAARTPALVDRAGLRARALHRRRRCCARGARCAFQSPAQASPLEPPHAARVRSQPTGGSPRPHSRPIAAGGDDVIRGSNDPLVKRRGDFLRCAEQADMIVFIDIP